MPWKLPTALLSLLSLASAHLSAQVYFEEDFSSYNEGERPSTGWTYPAPGANINEVTVRPTTDAAGQPVNALRVLHDYNGAGGEDSRAFGGFSADWDQPVTDSSLVYTTRFRFNEGLGSQNIRLNLTGDGVVGPMIRLVDDSRMDASMQGILANNGTTETPIIPGIIFGDWYELQITTTPTTGLYDVSVVNLNSSDSAQSGSMSGLSYWSGSGQLARTGLSRAGTWPQVDMSFESFSVVPEPSTYAALAGLFMLGFACLRRVRRTR